MLHKLDEPLSSIVCGYRGMLDAERGGGGGGGPMLKDMKKGQRSKLSTGGTGGTNFLEQIGWNSPNSTRPGGRSSGAPMRIGRVLVGPLTDKSLTSTVQIRASYILNGRFSPFHRDDFVTFT